MTKYPSIILDTAPEEEPLSLAETKVYLRVEHDDEDAVISRLITTARQKAENYLNRSLVTQRWKIAYDDYAPMKVKLQRQPVQSIVSVTMINNGVETTLDEAAYYLGAANQFLYFDVQPIADIVEILFECGYGDAADVPAQIRQGMLAHIAAMYDERDTAAPIQSTIRALYDDYRVVSL